MNKKKWGFEGQTIEVRNTMEYISASQQTNCKEEKKRTPTNGEKEKIVEERRLVFSRKLASSFRW